MGFFTLLGSSLLGVANIHPRGRRQHGRDGEGGKGRCKKEKEVCEWVREGGMKRERGN